MTNYHTHRFQIKTKAESAEEILVKFLKQKDGDLTEKERLVQALCAFWLPLALIATGGYSQKEIAVHGLCALQKLKQQINYLSLILSLEAPSYSHFFITNLTSEPALPLKNNPNGSRAQVRKEEKVKSYTELNNLDEDTGPYSEINDLDENDPSPESFTFSTNTVNQIDKIFEV